MLTRIAPSFLRFGSFQTCNPMDKDSKRQGPSAGMGVRLNPCEADREGGGGKGGGGRC